MKQILSLSFVAIFLVSCNTISAGQRSTDRSPMDLPTLENSFTPTLFLTPSSTPTASLQPVILFRQDFESGSPDVASWLVPGWKITVDGTGNHIYCNEIHGSWSTHSFGEDWWSNYSVELRVESLDRQKDSFLTLYARFNPMGDDGYFAGLNFQTQVADLQFADRNQYIGMGQVSYPTKENTWYTMRLDIYGNHIKYYIDNRLILFGEDNQRASGKADFDVGEGHQVCIDDIRVTALSDDGTIMQTPAAHVTPESRMSDNAFITPLFPEVAYGNQQEGLSFEYKVGCIGNFTILETCFLWDLDSVTVTTPEGNVVPLQKDFNINQYSGEEIRRWVIYGPAGSGLPDSGTYVFTYIKNNEIVLVQNVVFTLPRLVERPTNVVATQSGNELHVSWQPPKGISPNGHYKVIIGDSRLKVFATSQIFPWNSSNVVLADPPLVPGTKYDVVVDWGEPGGYSGSDVIQFIWSTP